MALMIVVLGARDSAFGVLIHDGGINEASGSKLRACTYFTGDGQKVVMHIFQKQTEASCPFVKKVFTRLPNAPLPPNVTVEMAPSKPADEKK